MAAASAASIGGAVKKALLQVGLLPAEITAGIGAPPECGVAAEWLPKPDPAPYGLASWTKLRWAEDIPRNRWVISFVQQAVDMAEMYQLPMGTGGWVQIRALFWRFPQLHEEGACACFGTAHFLARLVVKDQTRALDAKVVSGRVAVRRINALERLQGFVEDYASRLPPAAHLSVAELMGTSLVRKLFHGRGPQTCRAMNITRTSEAREPKDDITDAERKEWYSRLSWEKELDPQKECRLRREGLFWTDPALDALDVNDKKWEVESRSANRELREELKNKQASQRIWPSAKGDSKSSGKMKAEESKGKGKKDKGGKDKKDREREKEK
eukprot:g18878.t1